MRGLIRNVACLPSRSLAVFGVHTVDEPVSRRVRRFDDSMSCRVLYFVRAKYGMCVRPYMRALDLASLDAIYAG